MEQADASDIQATLQGDGNAFGRLIARHQENVARLMWRFTRDRAIYEELVQDVFVEAYFSLPGYKGRAPFVHWLRKIATRVGYRHWKRHAREKAHLAIPLQDWDQELEAKADALTPQHAADLLSALLERLPPRDRLVLTMMYFEDYTVAEIAEYAGWSQTMVKVQAYRARKKLEKLLREVKPHE